MIYFPILLQFSLMIMNVSGIRSRDPMPFHYGHLFLVNPNEESVKRNSRKFYFLEQIQKFLKLRIFGQQKPTSGRQVKGHSCKKRGYPLLFMQSREDYNSDILENSQVFAFLFSNALKINVVFTLSELVCSESLFLWSLLSYLSLFKLLHFEI